MIVEVDPSSSVPPYEQVRAGIAGRIDDGSLPVGTRLPPVAWHQVIRERRATFSCRPNLPRPAARSARAGLWLAGDYVCADYPATLEAAVRSGVAAARGILLN